MNLLWFWGTFAFTLADPNNVVAIYSLNTFAIPCISFWIFQKKFKPWLMLPCALLTFSGVLFIIQPSFIFSHSPPITTYNLIGYCLIFVSMCAMSLFVSYQRVTILVFFFKKKKTLNSNGTGSNLNLGDRLMSAKTSKPYALLWNNTVSLLWWYLSHN